MSSRTPQAIGKSLSSLIWPMPTQDFLTKHWQQNYFVTHGNQDRLRWICRELGPINLSSLIQYAFPNPIIAWFNDVDGRHISTSVNPSSAPTLHQSGATIYFHLRLNSYLHDWHSTLLYELGVPAGHISLFACKKANGTRLHFDANDNFTIQLSGTKTWYLKKNSSVSLPTKNWVPSTEVPTELRYYCPDALERHVPKRTRKIIILVY